jgi:glycine cleavage system transcriptional repressor
MSSRQFVISVMTRDRVGIVADVAGAIRELGGNLADLSQTVLCGHFTMILVAAFPPDVTPEALRQALLPLDPEEPFEIGIKTPASPVPLGPDQSEGQYVVTAAGPDQIGLVASISGYLRSHNVNIVDFTTQVDEGRYTMILGIDLPEGTRVGQFKADLRRAMEEVGVAVELQHRRIFVATNEV